MKKTKIQKNQPTVKTYEEEIEYVCPVRGLVKQKVKVQRIDAVQPNVVDDLIVSNSVTEVLDRKYSGLFLSDDSLETEEED